MRAFNFQRDTMKINFLLCNITIIYLVNAFVNFDYSQFQSIQQTLVPGVSKLVLWLNESSVLVYYHSFSVMFDVYTEDYHNHETITLFS